MASSIERTSGILLHPTSLPSRWGIGDLGPSAYTFIDFLQASRQHLWQVMPLGPTGYGDSPYQCFSAFAGNPLMISLDRLLEQGLLMPEDIGMVPLFPSTVVDYGAIIKHKIPLLRRSFSRFQAQAPTEQRQAFEQFRAQHQDWLDDYALFAALKEAHNGVWCDWGPEIGTRKPEAIAFWSQELAEQVRFHAYMQFLFWTQWSDLHRYAKQRNIKIIGDIPIFVAYDSADVWANRDIFALDEQCRPTAVAGVPPDYFSKTGQLWGNPLYRWEVLAQRGYDWWIKRVQAALRLVDIVRLDHFRGFVAYWAVQADEETAINGEWVPGPGAALFDALHQALGDLPMIIEDLGVITPDVEELSEQLAFPGMKVLQFAFASDASDPYLPHNYLPDCVVYTGTHDNDTTVGWWNSITPSEQHWVRLYLGRDGSDIVWDMIRLAFASVARMAIVPMQDVLHLGSTARMNTPGRPWGNWTWRYTPDMLTHTIVDRLRLITEIYGRAPQEAPPPRQNAVQL